MCPTKVSPYYKTTEETASILIFNILLHFIALQVCAHFSIPDMLSNTDHELMIWCTFQWLDYHRVDSLSEVREWSVGYIVEMTGCKRVEIVV